MTPKILPCYDNELYEVIGIEGPEFTLRSEDGKQYLRTSSQIKKMSREAYDQHKLDMLKKNSEQTSGNLESHESHEMGIPFDDEDVEEYVPRAPKMTTEESKS